MKVELMAPAKNAEGLIEAICAGADSVYLGLKKYNARCMTDNFDRSELIDAIEYAHSKRKRVYLTLNTLIKESEFAEAAEMAKFAVNAGIDAIIVQDYGLISSIRQMGIPIIASTQMTICNSRGVNAAKRFGFCRVVLSRELNISELAQLSTKAEGVEIECFIHGGLCMGYSGQCYLSAAFEKAAANRGICKTPPCWDNYTLYCNNQPANSGKLLRPKDMYGIHHIPFLSQSGISAFKIQGRTRNLDYVRNVVHVYRSFMDCAEKCQSDKLLSEAIQALTIQSPRGLMRGNLETTTNYKYVVESECGQIPQFIYREDYELCRCEKAQHLVACFHDLSSIIPQKLTNKIERIYLPFDLIAEDNYQSIQELRNVAPLFVILPTLLERYDTSATYLLNLLRRYGIEGASFSNIGDLEFLENINCSVSTERTFNVCNRQAIAFLKKLGIKHISFPFELNSEECMQLATDPEIEFERLVYGRPPLMQMKYCLISKTNECVNCGKCQKGDKYTLFGKYGFFVKICRDRSESTLFPIVKYSIPVQPNERTFLRFEFTDESTEQVNQILAEYSAGFYRKGNYLTDTGTA